MNLGEHLNATFNKAGVETENPALVELIKKVAALDISDELVTKFNTSFLTVEAAKSNSEIKKHFKRRGFRNSEHNSGARN
jgi:ribosomal protein L12E/L44/L45/RPP1/RPP2